MNMRLIKRLLLFVSEVGVVAVGFEFSLGAAAILGRDGDNYVPALVFFSGLLLTLAAVLIIHPKTRRWRAEYDAVDWALDNGNGKLHPVRVRCIKIAKRLLLWVPSAMAAVALWFPPVLSHVLHPRSHYLTQYRVPIPWSFMVITGENWVRAVRSSGGRSRFSVAPNGETLFTEMSFGAISIHTNTFEFSHEMDENRRANATQISKRTFRLGDIPFTCWQYRSSNRQTDFPPFWEVTCDTPVN